MSSLNSLSSRFWSTTNSSPLSEPPSGSTAVDSLLLWSVTTDNVEVLRLTLVNQQLPVDSLLNWRAVPAALPRRRTICMIAAHHGACTVLSFLLSHGADPNARSPDDGYTPLHCAAEGARPNAPQVIALLLQFGALPDVYDVAGRKPVDLLQPRLNQAQKDSVFSSSLLDGDLSQDAQGSTDDDSELDKAEYQTDAFRMYEFKVSKCPRTRAHDWTECPFAHPGEKARRRNPQKFVYCGSACPDFRKGSCKRGDACQYAHGVFECWLHPSRYRTQLCKDAPTCTRRVCFFAHSLEELRQPTETLTVAGIEGMSVGSDADACSEQDFEAPCGPNTREMSLELAGSVSVPPPSSPSSSVPSFGTSSEGGNIFSSSNSSEVNNGATYHRKGVACSSPLPVSQPASCGANVSAEALASTFRDLQLSTALEIARLRTQMYQNLSAREFAQAQNEAAAAKVSASMGALNFANRSASCESLDTSWINVLTSEDDGSAWLRNVAA